MDLYLDDKTIQLDYRKKPFVEVNMWSFIKCQLLASLVMAGIFYGSLFLIGVLIGAFA